MIRNHTGFTFALLCLLMSAALKRTPRQTTDLAPTAPVSKCDLVAVLPAGPGGPLT